MTLIYPQYQLDEIAHVFNGKTPAKSEQRDTGHPVLKIKNVSENQKFKGNFESFVDEDLAIKSKSKLINLDDTLILNAAHNADYVGSKQYRAEPTVVNALPTGEWLIVRASHEKLDPIYLNYWLRLGDTKFKIRNLVKGIHLYPKDVAKLKIPLPPLAEQKQIAAIFDAADSLRQKDQQLVEHYTALSQSLFLEMFGDDSQFPSISAGEVIDIRDGTHDSPKYIDKGFPLITSKNIKNGDLDFSSVNFISQTDYDQIQKRSAASIGDIIMPMIGTIGNPHLIVKQPNYAIKNVALFKFHESDQVKNVFIYYLLNSQYFERYVASKNKGGTQKFISLGDLRKMPIFVPPLTLQEQFAERVAIIEQQKQQAQANLQKSEALFNSLLQRAFTGELTADKAA